jgi:sterol desaturase/sphingolipid hydroxylase (fatty acid hydroxylase superfamily)
MSYDWQAGLVLFALVIALTKLVKFLVFKIPALEQERLKNRELDKPKLALDKYRPIIRAGHKVGALSNLVFFALVAPFCVTLAPQPWWRTPLDIFVILMVYDFFYYLTHRFLFHGQGYFRRVHAVHHQARNPSYIDAHYVHPVETFIGLNLFLVLIPLLSLVLGSFSVVTIGICFVIYTQLNILNHCRVELDHFPFRAISWITAKHAVHHENMHKGNYASISLFFDKAFGTLN